MLEHSTLETLFSTYFDAWGVARIESIDNEITHLKKWLSHNYHGDMLYLTRNIDLRANPCELLPGAKSMIMVLMNYYPHKWQLDNSPRIAAYAYGNDYHHIVKSKLTQIAEEINNLIPHKYSVFCDSAPVMERVWASKAGLGWIGRNGMLVNPKLGTFTFIGTLITTLELESSTPMENHCGTCKRCIEACPTNAIHKNKTIDARRCLSYQTIEKHGDMDEELFDLAGNTLYGCDRCQLVCPWNRFAKPHNHPELMPIDGIFEIDWSTISRSEFNKHLKFSPMQRAGLKKIKSRYNQIIKDNKLNPEHL
jgi:epoxyqueuosine reductase